jgi:predicted amidohydrolase
MKVFMGAKVEGSQLSWQAPEGGHCVRAVVLGNVPLMPSRSRPKPRSRLRVAAVQMKFSPTIAGNLALIGVALRSAARRGADVVLFPECATTGYACDFGKLDRGELRAALAQVGTWAAQHRVNVLIGSPVFAGRSLLNCLVVFDRAGRETYRHAKCQLTESDRRWFTPGNALALFEVEGIPATAIIRRWSGFR